MNCTFVMFLCNTVHQEENERKDKMIELGLILNILKKLEGDGRCRIEDYIIEDKCPKRMKKKS